MFELGGDVVPPAMAANLTRLIAESSGNGDAEADGAMRAEVVASYLDLLQKPKLSDVLLTVRFHGIYHKFCHQASAGCAHLVDCCSGWR